jgi:hypothetical protein
MLVFGSLTNESLITAYERAKKSKLEEGFIKALMDEIVKRDLCHLALEVIM